MNDATRERLLKTRKGSTFQFGVKDWEDVLIELGFRVTIAKTGRTVTQFQVVAPGAFGSALNIVKEPGYKRIHFYHLPRWLKDQNLDLVELSSKALGMDTPEVEKKLKELYVRDLTNTGTCAICEGNFKRFGANIGHHGFIRPGDGMLHGSCFGVGFLPYELSPMACEAYVAELNKALKFAHDDLENLPKRDRMIRLDRKNGIDTIVEITRAVDNTEFERLLERAIREVERKIEALNYDLKKFTAKVANWKPDELPEVKYAGKFKVAAG